MIRQCLPDLCAAVYDALIRGIRPIETSTLVGPIYCYVSMDLFGRSSTTKLTQGINCNSF